MLLPHTTRPLGVLRDLVALFDAGRREPLPLPLKTSYAWAEKRYKGRDPVKVASSKWTSNNFHVGDDAERAHVRVWGPRAPFELLLGPPRPGEEMPGEDTRLGASLPGCGCRCCAAEREAQLMDRFDLLGPLPTEGSTTVLQASAGTGKTFALAGLVTRYVAESDGDARGDAADHVHPRRQSRTLRTGPQPNRRGGSPRLRVASPPAITSWSASAARQRHQRAARQARLRDALAGFDAATIATTHEFCRTAC